MNYSVGDVLFHKRLGLVILTEKINEEKDSRMFGKILFKMELLNNLNSNNKYNLYENQLDQIRLASDNDYINRLTNEFLTFFISKDFSIGFNPETGFICLSDTYDTVVLSKKDFKKLKQIINQEFN